MNDKLNPDMSDCKDDDCRVEKIISEINNVSDEFDDYDVTDDDDVVRSVSEGLLDRYDEFSDFYCPCMKIDNSSGSEFICPCDFMITRVEKTGSCVCGLFVSSGSC